VDPEQLFQVQVPPEGRASGRRRILGFALLLLGLLALAALWQWTPLSRLVEAERLAGWIAAVQDSPWALPAVTLIFLVGSLLTVPLTVLVVATGLAFGPWLGFLYAYAAGLITVAITYRLGSLLGRRAVRGLAGNRINRFSRWLNRRGLPAIITVRIIPVAPFIVTNLIAGAVKLPYRTYLLGSAIGMVPGLLAITVFADRLLDALLAPDLESLGVLAGVTAVIVAGALLVRRLLRARGKRRGAGI